MPKKLPDLLPEICFEEDESGKLTEELYTGFSESDFEEFTPEELLDILEHHPDTGMKNKSMAELRRLCRIGEQEAVFAFKSRLIQICSEILKTVDNRESSRLEFAADFLCGLTGEDSPREATKKLAIKGLRWSGKFTLTLPTTKKRYRFKQSPNSTHSAVRARNSRRPNQSKR